MASSFCNLNYLRCGTKKMRQTLTTDNSSIFWNLSTIFSVQQLGIFVLEYKFYFLEYVSNLAHCNGIFKCKSKLSSGNKKITVCTSKKIFNNRTFSWIKFSDSPWHANSKMVSFVSVAWSSPKLLSFEKFVSGRIFALWRKTKWFFPMLLLDQLWKNRHSSKSIWSFWKIFGMHILKYYINK